MNRILSSFFAVVFTATLSFAPTSAWADSDKPDDDSIEKSETGPECPWKPEEKYKPAIQQCGYTDAAAPVLGLFDCGIAKDESGTKCVEHCVFKRCHNP
jgi:hypothetical protein